MSKCKENEGFNNKSQNKQIIYMKLGHFQKQMLKGQGLQDVTDSVFEKIHLIKSKISEQNSQQIPILLNEISDIVKEIDEKQDEIKKYFNIKSFDECITCYQPIDIGISLCGKSQHYMCSSCFIKDIDRQTEFQKPYKCSICGDFGVANKETVDLLLSLVNYESKNALYRKDNKKYDNIQKIKKILEEIYEKIKTYKQEVKNPRQQNNMLQEIEQNLNDYIQEVQKRSLYKFVRNETKQEPKPQWTKDIRDSRNKYLELQKKMNDIIQQTNQISDIFAKATFIQESDLQKLFVESNQLYWKLKDLKAH